MAGPGVRSMLEKHYGHTSNVVGVAEITKQGGSKTRKIGAGVWLME